MKRIRGGSGLGDAIYMRPIVEEFLRRGERVTVCSDYPEIFSGLDVDLERFNRTNINVLAHYTAGKFDPATTQWADVCKSAGVDVPLRFAWEVRNDALIERIRDRAAGRPLVLVHGGRTPMARTDGFGLELLPDRRAFEAALAALEDCCLVAIGKAAPIYPLPAEIDLNGSTSVSDLLDLAMTCDGVIAQCSFAVPLAEVFDKPLLVVWSVDGLRSPIPYIRAITPTKILSKPTSSCIGDDTPGLEISVYMDAWKGAYLFHEEGRACVS